MIWIINTAAVVQTLTDSTCLFVCLLPAADGTICKHHLLVRFLRAFVEHELNYGMQHVFKLYCVSWSFHAVDGFRQIIQYTRPWNTTLAYKSSGLPEACLYQQAVIIRVILHQKTEWHFETRKHTISWYPQDYGHLLAKTCCVYIPVICLLIACIFISYQYIELALRFF